MIGVRVTSVGHIHPSVLDGDYSLLVDWPRCCGFSALGGLKNCKAYLPELCTSQLMEALTVQSGG